MVYAQPVEDCRTHAHYSWRSRAGGGGRAPGEINSIVGEELERREHDDALDAILDRYSGD